MIEWSSMRSDDFQVRKFVCYIFDSYGRRIAGITREKVATTVEDHEHFPGC